MPAMNTAALRLLRPPRPLRPPGSSPSPRRRRQRGFTIIEMTVALFVTAEVILAALALFDFHNKLAHVQASISDMQQSLRVAQFEMVRLARMAGRGGIPVRTPQSPPQPPAAPGPAWGAVSVRNNVGGLVPDDIAIGYSNSPKAVDGSDILTLRGVFSTPIFQLDPIAKTLTFDTLLPQNATKGSVVVCAKTPTGMAQDLGPLISAVTQALAAVPVQTEAIILVSPLDETIYGVVELDVANSNTTQAQPLCPGSVGVLLAFKVTGDANAAAFQALSNTTSAAGLPAKLTSAAWLGIVEEYRYYVRQDYLVPGNVKSDPTPHLSRARMYPGTETPYYNDPANLQVDVADNVLDLQVALGVDLDANGLIENSPPALADEWIYDAPNNTLALQAPPAAPPLLHELRISTLASTGTYDFQYQGPLLTTIEDHVYKTTDFPNTQRGRAYRHRLLQTVVGLRNL
jgi:Tfp pilus assembly protein FimT